MTLETEASSFFSALAKVYHVSPNTIAAYRGDLADFSRFLGSVAAAETIAADQVRRYSAQISNRATRQRRLAGIKRFFRYLTKSRFPRWQHAFDHDPRRLGSRGSAHTDQKLSR